MLMDVTDLTDLTRFDDSKSDTSVSVFFIPDLIENEHFSMICKPKSGK